MTACALGNRRSLEPDHESFIIRNTSSDHILTLVDEVKVESTDDLHTVSCITGACYLVRTSGKSLYSSISAMSFPKQTLGPTPKVNCAVSSSKHLFSLSNQRSGTKASASGPYMATSRWTVYAWLVTSVPPGMKCPSMTFSPLGVIRANRLVAGGCKRSPSLMHATKYGRCARVSSYRIGVESLPA